MNLMQRIVLYGLTAVGSVGLLYNNANSQVTNNIDQRVKNALEKLGKQYEINISDNGFRIKFGFSDGRSQMVRIDSKTNRPGGFEVREIWSIAYLSEEPLSSSIINDLLEDNERQKIGMWGDVGQGNATGLIFTAKVPADLDALLLYNIVKIVGTVADEMEKKLTGKDEF